MSVCLGLLIIEVVVVDVGITFCGLNVTCEHLESGCFTSSVDSQQSEDLSLDTHK
jgi:hypothetical protein